MCNPTGQMLRKEGHVSAQLLPRLRMPHPIQGSGQRKELGAEVESSCWNWSCKHLGRMLSGVLAEGERPVKGHVAFMLEFTLERTAKERLEIHTKVCSQPKNMLGKHPSGCPSKPQK